MQEQWPGEAYVIRQAPGTVVSYAGQEKTLTEIPWGRGNLARNGCGVIAAYHLLLARDGRAELADVCGALARCGGPFFFGKFGVRPSSLYRYLRRNFGYVRTLFPWRRRWCAASEKAENAVMIVKWKKSMVMHYIAGVCAGRDGEGNALFRFYNSGLDRGGARMEGTAMTMENFLEAVRACGATALLLYAVGRRSGE